MDKPKSPTPDQLYEAAMSQPRDPNAPKLSLAEVNAFVAENHKKLEALYPQIKAALEKVQSELEESAKMTPEEAEEYFAELAKLSIAEGGKDYFNDPNALDSLLGRNQPPPPDIPTLTVKQLIMENFFKEWCVQCPIMQLFTLPPGEGDVEDTAGALCPDEVLDTCPHLLLLRDVQAIKPPADWLPGDTMETYLERKNSNANT